MGMNGVSYYTSGTATVRVHFPEDHTDCAHCPYCYDPKDDLARWKCRLTGEYLYAPKLCIGHECPITLDADQTGKEE